MNNTLDKVQWHPAFYSAMQMEVDERTGKLKFYTELGLTKKPLEVDMLIIAKEGDAAISNPIGHIFKKYNIVEYKSPDDKLNIDVFYKTIAYACLYKISGEDVDEYKVEEITITIIRERYPRKLFEDLKKVGFSIHEKDKGIYYIEGGIFTTQIIVTKLLDKKEHIWLTSLTRNISETDFDNLLEEINLLKGKKDEECADSILNVVYDANKEKIDSWKEKNDMRYSALERIMQPELQQSRMEGKIEGVIETMCKFGKSIAEISEEVHLSEEEINQILIKR